MFTSAVPRTGSWTGCPRRPRRPPAPARKAQQLPVFPSFLSTTCQAASPRWPRSVAPCCSGNGAALKVPPIAAAISKNYQKEKKRHNAESVSVQMHVIPLCMRVHFDWQGHLVRTATTITEANKSCFRSGWSCMKVTVA